MTTFDTVIIGSGILGCAAAEVLARNGQRVMVLERSEALAAHASSKNAGMIRHLYRHETLTAWAVRSLSLWPGEIKRDCFVRTGSVILGRTAPPHHASYFEEKIFEDAGGASGVYCAEDGLLDSGRFMSRLTGALEGMGIEIRTNFSAEICDIGGRWVEVGSTRVGERIRATTVVLAPGAWPSLALRRIGSAAPVILEPYARHLFLLDGWPEDFRPFGCPGFVWDEDEGYYLRPWLPGQFLLSICDTRTGDPDTFQFLPSVRDDLDSRLAASFAKFAPRLTVRSQRHCFRTYAPDKLPIMGPDPRWPQLHWLAGFGGFGMSTGYAAGRDAAAVILGGDVEIQGDFDVSRFFAPLPDR